MQPSNQIPFTSGLGAVSASAFKVGPESSSETFIERRSEIGGDQPQSERRQFGDSHTGLSEDGRELALAIDQYKVAHHRRYLTCDEMLNVIKALGYTKVSQ